MQTTEKMKWRREFETGIAEIDLQHRTLVKMFNRMNTELRDDSGRAVWENVIHELLGYALYHFWTEEDLAAQYGYDQERYADASVHFDEHRSFAESINDIRSRLRAGERIAKSELIDYFRDWLANHIVDSDQWLVAFVLEKQRLSAEGIEDAPFTRQISPVSRIGCE
jgi:hemerythrin-like metal-binding protein